VSKWERSEASPDTDNLIALAKIYGLSLDELVYGKKDDQQNTEAESEVKKDTEKVDIGPTGIFVESADGDKVHININGIKVTADGEPESKKDTDKVDIGPNGIFVESADGEKVQINLRGIKVTDGKHHIHINDDDDDDDDDDFDEDDVESIKKSGGKAKFWLSLPYPIICTIAYILLGCFDVLGGFGQSWIIFVTIPIYYSIVHAIAKKRFCDFAYPVFCAFTFLYLGMYHGNWHPSWVIFITIPVYYSIAGFLDKRIKTKENS
jgi:HTH-type transcriptional regulator/antitoxin HipB